MDVVKDTKVEEEKELDGKLDLVSIKELQGLTEHVLLVKLVEADHQEEMRKDCREELVSCVDLQLFF